MVVQMYSCRGKRERWGLGGHFAKEEMKIKQTNKQTHLTHLFFIVREKKMKMDIWRERKEE